MPATSGTAKVAGLDVFQNSMEVRRLIGYMPENNPLYTEMRVKEYLKFRARLKGLSMRKARERVDIVMEQCGISNVSKKVIAHLSKGYKQRVGLADALVNEPSLLILDEPTIGLDPNQIRTVRNLIKSLAGKHTILISTHILSEAELICNRAVILYEGNVLACDSIDNLRANLCPEGRTVIEVSAPIDELKEYLDTLAGVEQYDLSANDDGFITCSVLCNPGFDIRLQFFETAITRRWKIRQLSKERATLEDVFVKLTLTSKESE
jgi:ABC-2 type transport system ATP-binding protein